MKKTKQLKPPFWRTRTLGGFTTGAMSDEYHGFDGSTHVDLHRDYEFPLHHGIETVMTDKVTPGASVIVSQGGLINNGMSRVKTEKRRYFGQLFMSIPGDTPPAYHTLQNTGHVTGLFLDHASGPGMPMKELVNIDRLIKLATIQTKANVSPPTTQSWVTILEMNKTLELIADSATKLVALYRCARHGGTWKQAQAIMGRNFPWKPTKRPSLPVPYRKWLEWRYGWGPTVNDIASTLSAEFRRRELSHPRYTARGFATKTDKSVWSVSNIPAQNNGTLGTFDVEFTQEEYVNVRGYILYEQDLLWEGLRAFGIESIPSTAWELLPFSFVADWFIPIGDWIQALEPKLGVTELATGYTVERIRTLNRRVSSYTHAVGPVYWDGGNGLVGAVDTDIETLKYRVPSLPTSWYPPIDVKLNVKRALDAIALIATNGSKKLRV